jgi:hypothetical protein
MRRILADDARAHFGDEMKRNVWRMCTSRDFSCETTD